MKKGFTLIELLAVIIILTIVALIATPIVLDVVNDAKESAAKSEASMIVSGINNYCATADMKEQLDGTTSICKDGVTVEEVKMMVDLGNAKVNSIKYDKKVTSLEVGSNGRTVTYDGKEYIVGVIYYAFGTPTTSSSTNYQDVITESGSNVFVKLDDEQLSTCIYMNQTLECFKNNNYTEEVSHFQNLFGSENCDLLSSDIACRNDNFYCFADTVGGVYCQDKFSAHYCNTLSHNEVVCN